MHVVRPTGVLRKSEGNNNAIVAFTDEENPEFVTVQAPTQNKSLLQVIHFNNAFYAIDKYNTLVIAPERISRWINGRRVLSMAAMGENSLFFVLANKVLVTEQTDRFGDLKELITDHYDGEVSKIITGDSHAIFETKNGYYASGSNTSHEFGMKGDSTARPVPVPTLDILPIERIYCGGWHCYAKLRDGTFVGWGYNKDGRLGNGGTTNVETPTPLNHHKLGIYTLTCGGWHTVGLTHGGQMYVWGVSVDKCLGIEETEFLQPNPVLLNVAGIINVFSGNDANVTLAQTRTGEVFAWGKEFGDTPAVVKSLNDLAFRHVYIGSNYHNR